MTPEAAPLLVVVNGAAGSAQDEPVEAALSVLRGGTDVEGVATASSDELDDVVRRLGGRRPAVGGGEGSPIGSGSWRGRV